jgi:MFS family permease
VRLAIGIIVAGEGVGVGVGFILGGLLQSHPWNVAFWVLLAPAAVSLALIMAVVPGSAPGQAIRRFDAPGALLLLMCGVLGLGAVAVSVAEARVTRRRTLALTPASQPVSN